MNKETKQETIAEGEVLKATHQGVLHIGNLELECYVLSDGTRTLSERGLLKALGMKPGARDTEEKLPRYLRGKKVAALVTPELKDKLAKPVWFTFGRGKVPRKGLPATFLPDICDVWLKSRDAGVLVRSQEITAKKADILMRGLAQVGIVALVDEATGYQAIREKDELQQILSLYIAKEFLPWTKRFPDIFYEELFRLKGWSYNPMTVKRPRMVGKLTNELVYDKLPEGVLEELKKVTPKSEKGNYTKRFHQSLSQDIGNPHLEKHLASVITLMKVSPNWSNFKRLFVRAFGGQMDMGFEDDDKKEGMA